jgi:hypothetical protein
LLGRERTPVAPRCTQVHDFPVTPRPKVVYRITYPNGKIYVGLDLTGTTLCFGSPTGKVEIAADLAPEHRQDLTIRKEILWESMDATVADARAVEVRMIQEHRANDPEIGYNRRPRLS